MKSPAALIGREEQWSALLELEHICRAQRRPACVLLRGVSGSGKTTLAKAFLDRVDGLVLTGRGREASRSAYSPIIQALRNHHRLHPAGAAATGDPIGPLIELIAPDGATQRPSPSPSPAPEVIPEAFANCFQRLTVNGPVFLLLDDLHWADHATLALLPLLIEALRECPLMILGAYQTEGLERGHPLRRMRQELRRLNSLRDLPVEALHRRACATLIAARLDAPPAAELIDLIQERSGGLPLYIEELLVTLRQEALIESGRDGLRLRTDTPMPVPESLREAIDLQLAGLTPAARQVLEHAALAGHEFELNLVAESDEEAAGLDELVSRGLLVPDGRESARFRHGLLAEIIRDAIPWGQRRRLHRRLAERMEARGAPPDRRAGQWIKAGNHDAARDALLAAAEASCALHAYDDALADARQALKLWPPNLDPPGRLALLERMIQCAQLSNQLPLAERTAIEALAHPELDGQPLRHALLLRTLATLLALRGQPERAAPHHEQALTLLAQAREPAEAAIEAMSLSTLRFNAMLYRRAIDDSEQARAFAREAGRPDLEARALGLQARAQAFGGWTDEAHAAIEAALALVNRHELAEVRLEIYRHLGHVHAFAGENERACQSYARLLDETPRVGYEGPALDCVGCYCWALFRTGAWQRAGEMCRETIATPRTSDVSRTTALATLGLIHALRGEMRSARRQFQRMGVLNRRLRMALFDSVETIANALLAELENQPDEAEAHYLRLLDHAQSTEDRHDLLGGVLNAAMFFGGRGAPAQLARCAGFFSRAADQTRNEEPLACLAYALGATAMLKQCPGEAAEQFRRARAGFEDIHLPLETAVARLAEGTARLQAGETAQGGACIAEARREAQRLGARTLLTTIDAAVGSIVAPPADVSPAAPPRKRLTPRQQEILQHIGAGLTNKEIAALLHLSPRTIEMHVAALLDRLNCRTRAEAVRRGANLDLVG